MSMPCTVLSIASLNIMQNCGSRYQQGGIGMILRIVAALSLIAPLCTTTAHAQSWPAKPVRIIVPFAPGGTTDTEARMLARKYTESLGQSFVVENRAGAGGMIGAEVAVRAPADGYVLLFTSASLSVN